MISISPARNIEDFEAAAGLCRKLARWDAEIAPAYGVSAGDVLAAFHPDRSGSELAVKFTEPGASMLLARTDETPVGCLAFEPFDDSTSELAKFFVDPSFRGMGIGRGLLRSVIAKICKDARRRVLVHTAFYMESAIRAYTACGFTPCRRFRDTPAPVRHTDVFLARSPSTDAP